MTWVDWAALALFFICWLGYAPILKFIGRHGGSLNDDMSHVRRVWMASMTHREIRLVDSQLMGHSINSASFFASTNLLLIAAVGGILFGGESKLEGFAAVGADNVPIKILEAKLALVLICLARGFLDFIWALRQMNYTLALIGSAPEIITRDRPQGVRRGGGRTAEPGAQFVQPGGPGLLFRPGGGGLAVRPAVAGPGRGLVLRPADLSPGGVARRPRHSKCAAPAG
jgi:uncharacterized membrane protein